jgi:hypothetical protein
METRRTAFWDIFTAVNMMNAFWGMAVVRPDVSENMLLPSSV